MFIRLPCMRLVLVGQDEAGLAVGGAAPRDRLPTIVGSAASSASRNVGTAAMPYGVRTATSLRSNRENTTRRREPGEPGGSAPPSAAALAADLRYANR